MLCLALIRPWRLTGNLCSIRLICAYNMQPPGKRVSRRKIKVGNLSSPSIVSAYCAHVSTAWNVSCLQTVQRTSYAVYMVRGDLLSSAPYFWKKTSPATSLFKGHSLTSLSALDNKDKQCDLLTDSWYLMTCQPQKSQLDLARHQIASKNLAYSSRHNTVS